MKENVGLMIVDLQNQGRGMEVFQTIQSPSPDEFFGVCPWHVHQNLNVE